MNLKESNIQRLLEDHGATGLGAYVLLKDFVIRNDEAKESDILNYASFFVSYNMASSVLKKYNLFYTVDGSVYRVYNAGKSERTVDSAFDLFNHKSIKGVFFSKMKQIYNLTEESLMKEFNDWRNNNAGFVFKDDRHLENSFSFWLKNRKPESKPKETIDWSSL